MGFEKGRMTGNTPNALTQEAIDQDLAERARQYFGHSAFGMDTALTSPTMETTEVTLKDREELAGSMVEYVRRRRAHEATQPLKEPTEIEILLSSMGKYIRSRNS